MKKENKRKVKGILERGIENLYTSYIEDDMYKEDVDLIVGMRYGRDGIQPCHSGSIAVCESGDSLCGGFLGHRPINVNGTQLFIVMCAEGAQCRCNQRKFPNW